MIEQGNAVSGELQNKRTRQFLKKRAIDSALLTKAKMMLSRGVKPGAAALLLRLPVDVLEELYNGSFNPTCRQTEYKSQRQQSLDVRSDFEAGASLETLCSVYSLPLFTVIRLLQRAGVPPETISSSMPPTNSPLYAEYHRTIVRGQKRERKGHKAIKI